MRLYQAKGSTTGDRTAGEESIPGGIGRFSVLAGGAEDSRCGSLFRLADAEISSARRRLWCAVMDKQLFFFKTQADNVPQESVDLRQCTFTALESGVFKIARVRGPQSLFFLYVPTPSKRIEWMRALVASTPVKVGRTSTLAVLPAQSKDYADSGQTLGRRSSFSKSSLSASSLGSVGSI